MKRVHLFWALPAVLLSLTSCTQFPELEETQTPALKVAAFPELVPIDPILAQVNGPAPDPSVEQARAANRVARLRNRAQRLRGAVLNPQEEQRLKEAQR